MYLEGQTRILPWPRKIQQDQGQGQVSAYTLAHELWLPAYNNLFCSNEHELEQAISKTKIGQSTVI